MGRTRRGTAHVSGAHGAQGADRAESAHSLHRACSGSGRWFVTITAIAPAITTIVIELIVIGLIVI